MNRVPTTTQPIIERSSLIDALRGFALLGIILINWQAFALGVSTVIAPLPADAQALDVLTYGLIMTFVAGKFYPLFSFLFGYGFALQMRRWPPTERGRLFRRRLSAMFVFGVLHGTLIWFGDILSRYAIAGVFLNAHLKLRPKRLLASARRWVLLWLIMVLVCASALVWYGAEDHRQALVEAKQTALRYAQGSFIEIAQERLQGYGMMLVYSIFQLPEFVCLFLLGALVERLGWLRAPQRHEQKWRAVLKYGLAVGLPLQIAFGVLSVYEQRVPEIGLWSTLVAVTAPLLTAGYIACWVRYRDSKFIRRLITWFAPAGRVALSNYLLQSCFGSLLFYSYGLGLGNQLTHYQLVLIALLFFIIQMVLSHAWRHWIGPAEWVWRAYTYSRWRKTRA